MKQEIRIGIIGTGKSWHSGVIDGFIDSIRSGSQCRCTGREALRSMRAVFAALESSKTGKTIEIPENI